MPSTEDQHSRVQISKSNGPTGLELVCWWQHHQSCMLNSEERYCQTGGGADKGKRQGSRNQVTGEGAEEQKKDIGVEIPSYMRIHTTSKICKE